MLRFNVVDPTIVGQNMRQPLANAELAVMNLLWQSDKPLTAREIREQLYPSDKKAQHGTVQRLLQRLEEKSFIHRDKKLSVHFCAAAISRESYAGSQLESLADRLTSGSIAPLITHLVEHKKISKKELNEIRAILDSHGNGAAVRKKEPAPKPTKNGDQL